MPEYNRRQRSGHCDTCGGELRFYPAPLADEAAMIAEEETDGSWAHLNPKDWLGNPHPPVPRDVSAA